MTVSNASSKQAPQAMDGVAVLFSFTFEALPTILSGIKATILEKATGIETALIFNDGGVNGYTVVVNANGVGGSITVISPRTADFEITIFRSYAETQDTNYADFNAFPSETVEDNQDKLTFISQQQSEIVNRAIVLPITTQGVSVLLPTPTSDQFIGWNTLATALENKPDPSTSATASATAAAASAAAALVSETNAATSAAASAVSAAASLVSETASGVSAAAALVSETNAAASAASIALPTVTFPAQEGLILVARAAATPDNYALETQGVATLVDDFTIKNNGGIISTAPFILDNIMLNALQIAEGQSLSVGSMVDGVRDTFADETGIDLINSADQVFEGGSYRTPVATTTNPESLKLLFNEAVGSLEIADQSGQGHVITQVGNATLKPNHFQFGNGSLSLEQSLSQELTISNSTDFDLGNLWTIDFWIYVKDNSNNGILWNSDLATNTGFSIKQNTVNNGLDFIINATVVPLSTGTNPMPLNQWNHYTFTRISNNNWGVYLDGIQVGHSALTTNIIASISTLKIGHAPTSSGGNWVLDVYSSIFLDDLRITNNNAFSAAPIPQPFLHYTLDDNAATTVVNDFGTGANNGTTVGGFTNTFHADGKVRHGFNFDGTTDYITDNTVATATRTDTLGTIIAWINPDVISGNRTIMEWGDLSVAGTSFLFRIVPNIVQVAGTLAGVTQFNFISVGTISPNVWTHIAVVQDGVAVKIYINGVDDTTVSTGSGTEWLSSTGAAALDIFTVGAGRAGGTPFGFWNGRLDDVRYYSGVALTQPQVESIRVAGVAGVYGMGSPNITVPTAAHMDDINTLLLLPFDSTIQGNDLIDISTPPHTVTSVAGAGVIGKFNNARVSFDGVGDHLTIPDAASLDFGILDFSISSWVRNRIDGTIQYYLHKRTGAGSGELEFFKNASNQLVLNTNNGTAITATSVITLNDRDWHFVTAVRVGSDLGVYLDTAQIAFATGVIQDLNSTGSLFIGSDVAGLNAIDGEINDFHLSNANPLSAAPVVGLTDTITVPFVATVADANSRLLIQDSLDKSDLIHIPTFNGVSISTATPQPGQGTGYISFNGTSDDITIPDHSSFDLVNNHKDDRTIHFWARHTDHIGTEVYMTQFVDVNNRWAIQHVDASGLSFLVVNSGVTTITTVAGGEIADNNWHHIALIKVGSESSLGAEYGLYNDGIQIGYVQDASIASFSGSLILGQQGGALNFFDGDMDTIIIQEDNTIFTGAPNPGLTDTITVPVSDPVGISTAGVMTLRTNAVAVAPLLPAPSTIKLYIDCEDISPTVIANTDFRGRASRDGGTTFSLFTASAFARTGQATNGRQLYEYDVDVSTQPDPGAGLSTIVCEVESLNDIQFRLHAMSKLWG